MTRRRRAAAPSAPTERLEVAADGALALRRVTRLAPDPRGRGRWRVRRQYARLGPGGAYSYGDVEYTAWPGDAPDRPGRDPAYGPLLRGRLDLATGVLTLDPETFAPGARPPLEAVVAAQRMADALLAARRGEASLAARRNPAGAEPAPDEELLDHRGGHELLWWTALPRDPKFPRRRRERERALRLVYAARPGQRPGEFFYRDTDYLVAQRTQRRHDFATRVALRGAVDPATGALALDVARSMPRPPLAAIVDAQQMLDRLRARLAEPVGR